MGAEREAMGVEIVEQVATTAEENKAMIESALEGQGRALHMDPFEMSSAARSRTRCPCERPAARCCALIKYGWENAARRRTARGVLCGLMDGASEV